MTGYILRRILATIPVFLIVALVVFSLMRFAPGDPASIIAGQESSEQDVQRMREKMGLDRSLPVQLGIWFKDLARGDLGDAIISKQSVVSLIADRILPTLSLALWTEAFAILLAVPLGVLAAWKAHSLIDRGVMVFSTLGYSIPVFWLGFMLIYLFSVKLGWFPVAGYRSPTEGLLDYAKHLALPVFATGVIVAALIARMTRSTVLEVLQEDYVRTARAKGLAENVVLMRHALKNAAIPILTVTGLAFAALLGGLVITENVFAIPGLGRLLLNAIQARDYPVIQGSVLMVSFAYVFVNLLVDISYTFFDPRIRY